MANAKKPTRRAPLRALPNDPPGTAPRVVAIKAVRRILKHHATAPVSLERSGLGQLNPKDAALAWNVVHTALRWTGPLMGTLPKHQRKQALSGEFFGVALWLAMTDALVLENAPHAVVNLWVEALKHAGSRKAAGALNATLRKLLGGEHTLDPSVTYPKELGELLGRFGKEHGARLLENLRQQPVLAAFALETGTPVEQQGIGVEGWPTAMDFTDGKLGPDSGELKMAAAGGQTLLLDPVSAYLALTLPVSDSLLDLCAGAGIKSRLLHERERTPKRHVLVSDQKVAKLGHWRASKARRAITVKAAPPDPANEQFQTVWVDAPCSGSGTLARNPEARFRLSKSALNRLHATQIDLLMQAAGLLKKGGQIVYLTCSLHKEENEDVIKAFRTLRPDFKTRSSSKLDDSWPVTLVPVRGGTYVLPPKPGGDAFFVSVLRQGK